MSTTMNTKFSLGRLVATPAALEALERNNVSGREYLKRHSIGDWGEVCEEDGLLNDESVKDGSRILSAYSLPDETTIWIITDATVDDEGTREVTTILLPEGLVVSNSFCKCVRLG